MSNLIETTKAFRVRADSLIEQAKQNKFSVETTLAYQSLQMGKSWLGKLLGELGTDNPYPAVDNAVDIPPTQDTCDSNDSLLEGEPPTKLEFCNQIREDIEALVEGCEKVLPKTPSVQYAVKHFSEARFWYGFQLAVLREAALGTEA